MPANTDAAKAVIAALTSQETAARLTRFGPNEPTAAQHHSVLCDVRHVFANSLLLILVFAAIASAFLGQTVDAVTSRA